MDWQLQEAKNKFSRVVNEARTAGAQFVTLRGKRAAVVLSVEDYEALMRQKPTIVDDLLAGPEWDDAMATDVTTRAKTPSRDSLF